MGVRHNCNVKWGFLLDLGMTETIDKMHRSFMEYILFSVIALLVPVRSHAGQAE